MQSVKATSTLPMRSRLPLPVLLCAVLVLTASAASAATLIVPPDNDVIDAADAIVIGTLEAANGEFLLNGDIITNIDLRIERVLKGSVSTGPFRIRELGGTVGNHMMMVSEAPAYWLGNRALIFLEKTPNGDWRTYATSIGKFDFVTDSAGRKLAVRWARQEDVVAYTPEGHPHEEQLRDAEKFLDYIAARANGSGRRRAIGGSAGATNTADYFVDDVAANEFLISLTQVGTVFPPTAYTAGNFRWDTFDKGGSVTFYTSGTQPGYDGVGAATRALSAWTSDPGSNINYQYGGSRTGPFAQDNTNTIVFNSSTDVPAGAVGYAKWYGGVTHKYKGETFFTIIEGDVVVKSNISITQKVFDEVVTHELGHTLGFRHSDQGTPSSNDAVMRSIVTGAFGAALGPWDKEAASAVYGGTAPDISPLPVPTNVVATATAPNRVTVTWSPVPGATRYDILRSTSAAGPFVVVAPDFNGTTFVDPGVSPGITYVYRVRAKATNALSPDSASDYATTIIFTDDPLQPATTQIKAVHLTELRQAVNALRVAAGLPTVSWTDPNPAGVTVKAIHVIELRNAILPALSAFGRTYQFTYPFLNAGSTVRAVHFQELRNLTK